MHGIIIPAFVRPYQINVSYVSWIIYLLRMTRQAGKNKLKVYYEMISITKITMIAKYLKDTTLVHS